ncbi:MAG: hypothetical protein GF308_10665 [Candidatus Heimdallarchaeota archaeon]|nr:hypothetical protein [Candidatus Heimdallarchaeota archaeon]
MTEITIKIDLPKDILEKVDLEKIVQRLEKEILIEYTMHKLHGKFQEKNIKILLTEVEEEWGL